MRPHVKLSIVAAAVGLAALTLHAQERGRGGAAPGAPPGRGRGGPGYLKLFDSNMPFDPHDLAGIWSPNANGFGGKLVLPDRHPSPA